MSARFDLRGYRAFLVDLDGVLARGDGAIPGSAEAFGHLQELGRVVLFSNNSTRSRAAFAQRLRALGFSIEAEKIVNSAYVVAQRVQHHMGKTTVFAVGESGLREELEAAGHRVVGGSAAASLVVGMDRALEYAKLSEGLRALLNGAAFFASNDDRTYPTDTGLIPGAGATVGAFRGMGFEPVEVVGKPSLRSLEVALTVAGCGQSECLIIGDRLETDIAMAAAGGCDSVLVLSGVAQPADLEGSAVQPTVVYHSLADLVEEALDGTAGGAR